MGAWDPMGHPTGTVVGPRGNFRVNSRGTPHGMPLHPTESRGFSHGIPRERLGLPTAFRGVLYREVAWVIVGCPTGVPLVPMGFRVKFRGTLRASSEVVVE